MDEQPKKGRPRKPDAGRNKTMRLPPDVIEMIDVAGTAEVVRVLRAGLSHLVK